MKQILSILFLSTIAVTISTLLANAGEYKRDSRETRDSRDSTSKNSRSSRMKSTDTPTKDTIRTRQSSTVTSDCVNTSTEGKLCGVKATDYCNKYSSPECDVFKVAPVAPSETP